MKAIRLAAPLAAAALALAAAGTAGAAAPSAPSGTRGQVMHPMDNYGCPYTALCIWSGPNRSGTKHTYWSCGVHTVNLAGAVSWDNNQTKGTRAKFKTKSGWNASAPGAWSYDGSFASKDYVYAVDLCT